MVASPNRRVPTFSFSINPYADTTRTADLTARLSGCSAFHPLSRQLHDGMTSRIHGPSTLTDEEASECGKPRNDNAAAA
jgi:hypothetical protein